MDEKAEQLNWKGNRKPIPPIGPTYLLFFGHESKAIGMGETHPLVVSTRNPVLTTATEVSERFQNRRMQTPKPYFERRSRHLEWGKPRSRWKLRGIGAGATKSYCSFGDWAEGLRMCVEHPREKIVATLALSLAICWVSRRGGERGRWRERETDELRFGRSWRRKWDCSSG